MPPTDDAAIGRVRSTTQWTHLAGRSAGDVRAEVRRLGDLGVGGALVPQVFAPPWATLGAAAAAGELELASGIAMAFVRSPLETAMAALDLDRLSGGRFTLGLGTSVRVWNEQRFGVPYDRPVARLRELVTIIRRMTTTDEQPRFGRFEGEFWSVDLTGVRLPRPARPRLPITLAPLRPTMIELAAELADGILGHPVWSPRWIRGGMADAVARGLARSGRERGELRITAWLRVAIVDDESEIDAARRAAKPGIPFYASLAQYDSYFAALGVAEDARALQRAAAAGASAAEMAAAVSDALVDELVVIGTAGDVARRIASVLDVVDDLCITPPNGLAPDQHAAYQSRIEQHLYRAS